MTEIETNIQTYLFMPAQWNVIRKYLDCSYTARYNLILGMIVVTLYDLDLSCESTYAVEQLQIEQQND